MVILAGLERYVESGAEEAFIESVKSKITKEEFLKTQNVGMGSRYVQACNFESITISLGKSWVTR